MKFALAVLLSLAGLQALAATEKGYTITSGFEYKVNGKTVKSKSTFLVSAGPSGWMTLGEPKQGVALLGKIKSADEKSLHIEYIVIDTTQNNAVVSTPAIATLFGESAEIVVTINEQTGDKVAVNLLAQQAEYTAKK